VTLVWWLGYGVTGAVISTLCVSVVQIAGSLRPVLRDGIGFSRRLVRASLSYGLRIQVAALFRMAAGRFDLLLLSLLVPLSTVGYYAIAQIVSELVLLMPRAFGTVLVPVLAGDSRDARLSAPAVRLSGTLSLVAVAGVAALGPLLIVFGYGPAYTAAIVPLLILLPGIWFQSAGDLSSYVLAGRGRPGASSVLAVVQGVATVALDLVLIPPFGAVGAAVASLLAYTVYGLVSLRVLGRESGEPVRSMLVVNRVELGQIGGKLRQLAGRGGTDGNA
jgi:O-antigen/teichoic acid export membrane protein